MLHTPKRWFIGRPLRSDRLGETLLPKRLALPVFCSDPLSSVAYATEQIVLVLGLGGLGLLYLTPWLGTAVVVLLVVVVASYRQTCYAYPNGGGAYAVSRDNLGVRASLVAASALLVDYVLTVAVSVVAGVAAITSAIPALAPHAVVLSLALVVLLTVVNLRGVKESGRAFAVPTYGFVAIVFILLAVAGLRLATGQTLTAESASWGLVPDHRTGGLLTVFLALRAFASGCTALTGVEAVSNGVPSFEEPKSRNAATTLATMGGLAITMFAGITALAVVTHVHMAEDPAHLIGLPAGQEQRTALSQIGLAVFGGGPAFYLLQAFTAAILVLAANTAYNGFPVLASLLAHDGHLPRQLARRGDRLVFSNGIVLLAAVAGLLIVAFDADVTRLIQLYIIGVFVSFTLSQAGMVRHWSRELRAVRDPRTRRSVRRSQAINATGAAMTTLVLLLVLVTKFTHGAWIVVIAMPLLFVLMLRIRRHYDTADAEAAPRPGGVTLPSRIHAVVPVVKINEPTLRTLAFARAIHPDDLTAVTVRVDPAETDRLFAEWVGRDIPVPLAEIDSPFRDIVQPLVDHVRSIRRSSPRDVVCVFIPEYVVGHWWEALLHNQTALWLKTRLLFQPGVMVTSVPWQPASSHAAMDPEDRTPVGVG
ncbi:APC family permease [Geodermatophilus ruber]|uniref:Amino acid/polyamine/organocation transporter, APC superfamily n=1 Tax=Geodermatophilus ruber TaxID=504800 RepID=A0A1I4D6K4_9ACTN|nr:APC family permease [Geodermatophilus ruber]SFK88047.1 amino acid/polyamine/organocation transporter, APC superfamily [Geodermatophilus ruber]